MTTQHKAKRWQFGLRPMLVVVTLAAVVAAWWPTVERRRAGILRTLRRNAERASDDMSHIVVLQVLGLDSYEIYGDISIWLRDPRNKKWEFHQLDCFILVSMEGSDTRYSKAGA
jgi:hypothetical protein